MQVSGEEGTAMQKVLRQVLPGALGGGSKASVSEHGLRREHRVVQSVKVVGGWTRREACFIPGVVENGSVEDQCLLLVVLSQQQLHPHHCNDGLGGHQVSAGEEGEPGRLPRVSAPAAPTSRECWFSASGHVGGGGRLVTGRAPPTCSDPGLTQLQRRKLVKRKKR